MLIRVACLGGIVAIGRDYKSVVGVYKFGLVDGVVAGARAPRRMAARGSAMAMSVALFEIGPGRSREVEEMGDGRLASST